MAAYFEKLHKMNIGSSDETYTFVFMKEFIKWAISELFCLEGRTSMPYNWLYSGYSSPCIQYFFFD